MQEQAVSILQLNGDEQFKALQKSRLANIITDKNLLPQICEAAVHLLVDPKVRMCTEDSVLGALLKAVNLGFRLPREFGECYLIPRQVTVEKDERGIPTKKEWQCSFQIGYKGWKALALQSGHIQFLEAHAVYEEDEFAYKYGSAAFLDHTPANENSGKTKFFYACTRTASGQFLFHVINKQDAEKSRQHSEEQYDWTGKQKVFSQQPKGIWAKHYAAMALRVPIKKLCEMLPLTPAIETALREDGGITYLQKDGTVTQITPVEVEAVADQPQDAESVKIPDELEGRFYDVANGLADMTMDKILELWTAQVPDSPLMKMQAYVKLFFDAAMNEAETAEQLLAFMNACPKQWKAVKSLRDPMAILYNKLIKSETADGTPSKSA